MKEIHSVVREGTDMHIKQNQQTQNDSRNKCIILSNTIQKDLKIDIENHVAYTAYATT